jgi:hypothetical protein
MIDFDFLVRWLHIVVGVMWIGLLYFFNFVQVPALAQANAEASSGGPALPPSANMLRLARCSGFAMRRSSLGSPVPTTFRQRPITRSTAFSRLD